MPKKKFYITTPIYYVNDVPHAGHAYSTVGADVLARYKRACGEDVYFLTGTDEHGQKVEKASKEKGYASPQELVDATAPRYQAAWTALNISHDRFIRTTDADHKAAAAEFWKRVAKGGFIEKRKYTGWYCVHEETFWPEPQLVQPGNLCPDCRRPTTQTEEENFFFKQTAFADEMRKFVHANPGFVQPDSRRNEILGSYLDAKDGVLDQSISRSSFKWGIPVPGDDKQVIYVWFDALINYVTGAGWLTDPARFEATWPADVHIIGKDILRFHAVLWPAMLKAAGLPIPKKVFGTGYLVNDGKKMSKSLGNVIDPIEWAEKYGADVFRYYILREVPFGMDGSLSEGGIQMRYNTELANDLGNLLNRSLTMLEKYCGGSAPAPSKDALGGKLDAFWGAYSTAMDHLAFDKALDEVFALVREANRHIDEKAPWKLAKDPANKALLDATLYNLMDVLRVCGFALSPFMPATAAKMLEQLGLAGALKPRGELAAGTLAEACAWGGFKAGQATAKGQPLFPRAEPAAAKA